MCEFLSLIELSSNFPESRVVKDIEPLCFFDDRLSLLLKLTYEQNVLLPERDAVAYEFAL